MGIWSGRDTSITIRIDDRILLLARMRALRERASVNQLMREFLEQYAANAVRDPDALWPPAPAPVHEPEPEPIFGSGKRGASSMGP